MEVLIASPNDPFEVILHFFEKRVTQTLGRFRLNRDDRYKNIKKYKFHLIVRREISYTLQSLWSLRPIPNGGSIVEIVLRLLRIPTSASPGRSRIICTPPSPIFRAKVWN